MYDGLCRSIDYARISITDRCNLRCVYCMPEEGVPKRSHAEILSYEDIVRISRAFAALGIRKLKITGGEPLVRRGVADLAAALKAVPGIETVTLTTNGILLHDYAGALHKAGVDGVNVSLDSLDPATYARLTRGGDVRLALRGLDAALDAGFAAVKVNCVPFADSRDEDILALAALGLSRPVHVRFIEVMPMGRGATCAPYGREALRTLLESAYGPLARVPGPQGNGPARYFSLPGFLGTIGFIHTLDHSICKGCNRIRLTADGTLKTCLHMDRGVDMKEALAGGMEELKAVIAGAITRKPDHHRFGLGTVPEAESRAMSQIGG